MCLSPQVAYLLVYGELPSSKELSRWDEALMRHSAVPDAVERAVAALPHDAHFMGIVLVALNALSTVHPEQNPALAGRTSTSPRRCRTSRSCASSVRALLQACRASCSASRHRAVKLPCCNRVKCPSRCAATCRSLWHVDTLLNSLCRQQAIWRAGKMPAIAAMAYHRASGRNFSQPNQRMSYSENFLYMLDAANKPGYKPNPR